ncbi:F-box/LRR-repeat protein 2-like [Liolophura sinensis]|uniref:F-box/LRR-repeat protein 2-like n=1 Tax=Liolophura sinensis TaxID=3198878 RepID=UPI00315809A6
MENANEDKPTSNLDSPLSETTHCWGINGTPLSSGRNAAVQKEDNSFDTSFPETFHSFSIGSNLSSSGRNAAASTENNSGMVQQNSGSSNKETLDVTLGEDPENGVGDFIGWMPQEIVIKILSYLRPQELSMSVAPVSRRWHNISHDPALWQELNIKSISSVNLCKVVRQCTSLRRLVLQGRDNLSVGETMVITDFCTLLKELDLSFSKAVTADHLKPFVDKCLLLEYVNVEGCENVDRDVVTVLARAPCLCRLNFSHCTRLRDSDVLHLAQNLTKITALNIDGILWVTDESVIQLVQLHFVWLTSLVLDGEKLSDSSIESVSECSHLTQLSLSFSEELTDTSLVFLQELSSLTDLRLKHGAEFTSQGLVQFFQGPSMSALRHLNLSECTELNDEGVLSLAKCCGSTLCELQLCWCWNVTDRGLISIIDHCGKLQSLILTGVVTLRGEWLDRIQDELPYLKMLDLQKCHGIEDEMILTLVKCKKDLTVLNFFGQICRYFTRCTDL